MAEPQFIPDNQPQFIPDEQGPNQEISLPQFGKNILSSGADFVSNLASTVAHPINAATGLAKIGLGAIEKLTPETPGGINIKSDVPAFEAAGDYFKKRYGSVDSFSQTAYKDPVGMAADISALLSGGGSLLKGAGKLAGSETLSSAGKTLVGSSQYLNPLNAIIQAGKPVASLTGKVAAPVLGRLTGTGTEAVKAAMEPSQDFTDTMRGAKTEQDVLGEFKDALQNIKNQRAQDYQGKLAEVSQQKGPLDLTPVRDFVQKQLDHYNIKEVPDMPDLTDFPSKRPGMQDLQAYSKALEQWKAQYGNAKPGTLDFSRSTISNPASQKDVAELIRDVNSWDDATPLGVDTLKRRIGDIFTPSSQARAFVAGTKQEIKNVLSTVPGYSDMTQGYHVASDLIDNIDRDLSLSGKNPGTAIRKLSTALNQNNKYRQTMVEALDNYSQSNLKDQLAGLSMNSPVPRGLMGPLAGTTLLYNMLQAFNDPSKAMRLIPYLATSPRIVGETLNLLSKVKNAPVAATYRPFQLPELIGGNQ